MGKLYCFLSVTITAVFVQTLQIHCVCVCVCVSYTTLLRLVLGINSVVGIETS